MERIIMYQVKQSGREKSSQVAVLFTMLDIMKTRGDRIRHVREQMGLSQEAFGKRLKVAKAAVSNWERDEVDTIRSDNLLEIQRISGFNATWIETGRGPERMGVEENRAVYNVEDGPPVRAVPLISWVQAGQWSEAVDNFRPGKGEKMVWTTKKTGSRAYALRVVGDSMENPNGRPTYPAGSVIIVDPDREAANLSPIICRLENSKEATFKQLVIEGAERYLKPLNPRYPVMRLEETATICGVIVQTFMDEE